MVDRSQSQDYRGCIVYGIAVTIWCLVGDYGAIHERQTVKA